MAVADLAAVVLAAGEGTRLRPLTLLRPKPLCPVDNVALLDSALARVAAHTSAVAVNAHYLAEEIIEHVGERAHVSVERERRLGTAGALGALRQWLDGRAVLLHNGDSYLTDDLASLVAGWEGRRVRLLVRRVPGEPGDFGDRRYVGAALLPPPVLDRLTAEPSGLYRLVFEPALRDGTLELVETSCVFFDCGTPSTYLAANLHASGGAPVVAPDALVRGRLERSVVWPASEVGPDEHLVDVIRAGPYTVDGRRGTG